MFQRYTLAVIFLIVCKRDARIDFEAEQDQRVKLMEKSARDTRNLAAQWYSAHQTRPGV